MIVRYRWIAPAAPAVDRAPVVAAGPGFDGLRFLAVARETYGVMREAWENHDATIAADLMGVEVAADLAEAIVDDRAAHRVHLLPGIEIHEALITSAEDRVHALLPEARGGWDFTHQGWNVTAIERVSN